MPITINGSGTVTGITAGGLPDGVITTDDIAAAAVTSAKLAAGAGGKILQVVKNQKTDTTSTTTINSWVSMTGCTVTITPASASNKVMGWFAFAHGANTHHYIRNFRIVRSTTAVSDVADATGGAANFQATTFGLRSMYDDNGGNYTTIPFFDNLSGYTSGAITYQLQLYTTQAGTYWINRSDADLVNFGRGAATFIAMEVAA